MDFSRIPIACRKCGDVKFLYERPDIPVKVGPCTTYIKRCEKCLHAWSSGKDPEPNIEVKGIRIKDRTGERFDVRIRVALMGTDSQYRSSDYIIRIIEGGVTGHESWYVTSVLIDRLLSSAGEYCANAGGMGWDELKIPAESCNTIAHAFNLNNLVLNERK